MKKLSLEISSLNSGIRKLVIWLNSIGFETTDSGDGKTHQFTCDRDYAYVIIKTNPMHISQESNRLMYNLIELGISFDKTPMYRAFADNIPCDVKIPYITGIYDPEDGLAHIELGNVLDDMINWEGIDLLQT